MKVVVGAVRLRSVLCVGLSCGVILAALTVGGCATSGSPVVVERSGGLPRSGREARSPGQPRRDASPIRGSTYSVKRGDTLYSIGRRAGTTVAALAHLNGLRSPYRIYPGMKLRLKGRPVVTDPSKEQTTSPKPQGGAKPSERRTGTRQVGGLTWRWPAKGPVVKEFGGVNKGLDFSVPIGAKVQAAAAGQVVYAAAGLAGYESLVIVRHNAEYLSAYSVNQPLAVKENQWIKAGHTLATIRGGRTKAQALHFEIRRNGEPISPRTMLR